MRIVMSGCARYLPFCSYLIELARHRDEATVAGNAPDRRSQPSVLNEPFSMSCSQRAVLDVKRLHRRFVKSRARQGARWAITNRRCSEKSFVRQREWADEAVVLSRGRENRGAALTSRRKRAAPRSHSKARTEGAERARIRTAGKMATIMREPHPSSSLANQRADGTSSSGFAHAASCQAALPGSLVKRPWLSPRGWRSHP